jgi:hypothetical protein
MWAQRLGNIFHFLSNRLDGKNVVFGSVVEGMELIRQMEELGSEVYSYNIASIPAAASSISLDSEVRGWANNVSLRVHFYIYSETSSETLLDY